MLEKFINLILNYVEPEEEIGADALIKSDLGMSSFDLVCLSRDIADEFGASVTPDDFKIYDTVGKISDYIEEQTGR